MFSNVFGKTKEKTRSKKRADKISDETDATQDSGYYTASAIEFPTIEEWIAGKDQFRVVAVGHARPFPMVRQISSNNNLVNYHRVHVAPHISPILASHRISFTSIALSRRKFPGAVDQFKEKKTDHDLESLVISSTGDETLRWGHAVAEIFGLYEMGGFGQADIEVEICNPLRMIWNRSHVLGTDENVLSAFKSLRPAITEEVRSRTGTAWSSIAFHTRSHVGIYPGPEKPTCIIFFHEGSQSDFDTLNSNLARIMKTANVELYHEIQVGSVWEAWSIRDKAKLYNTIPETASNGASIGLKGDIERAGTLGGWLMLNIPKCPPVKVAITCHHLISGNDPANIQEMDRTGLSIAQARKVPPLQIVYPAELDMRATIENLETQSSDPDSPAILTQHLQNACRISGNPPIGQVIAASGIRLNSNRRRMDWALIQVPGTKSRNNPPPRTGLRLDDRAAFPKYGQESYMITADSIIRQFGVMKKDSWVVKNGRTTAVTSGKVNSMTRTIQWDSSFLLKESEEVEVIGLTDVFAHYGDSGSFVCDETGALVGLLFAMDLSAGEYGGGFVTLIMEIQADVKVMTNGFLSIDT